MPALSPHPLMILPFAILLASIAIFPLLAPDFWAKHHAKVAASLAAISASYYVVVLRDTGRMLHVTHEYFTFIVLISALFVVAGGIHISVQGEATPARNVAFLFIGALLANIIGTTGASVLLIRPWIRMNRYRITAFHVVFFIFIVANCGGCLTAIGDPPLFLGYLRGVPFGWVPANCWTAWLATIGLLLTIFFVLDRRNFMRAPEAVRKRETAEETFRLQGAKNILWLAVILGAVFIREPFGLRELLIVIAAACSYRTTPQPIHAANHFSFAPVKEVAWLFLGIFITMTPALDYLQLHAANLGLHTPRQFYWWCGTLSTLLDNAPTYLAFLAVACGSNGMALDQPSDIARFVVEHRDYMRAISLGSVFFGAITYIGNAPNFMVKAIADHHGVHAPSFVGYIVRFALPVLLPVLALIGWVFLEH